MSEDENKELMPVTSRLAILISVCNLVGLLLVIISPLVTDHLTKPPVEWPPLLIWSVPFIFSFFTYCSLTGWSLLGPLIPRFIRGRLVRKRRVSRANSFRAFFPVLIGGILI